MLNVQWLKALPKDGEEWESDPAHRGHGALWARKTPRGAHFYFKYSHGGAKGKLWPIGAFDKNGVKGLTLEQAREKFGAVSLIYRHETTDIHGHFERQREATERARVAEEESRRRAIEEAQRGTLRQLLDARVAYLKQRGSTKTARDERSMFNNHVIEAAKELADSKATDIGVPEFVGLISKLVDAGKGRAADKLRSSLRASYQLAIDSTTKASIPITFRTFGITVNPLASIGALSEFNKSRERVLSAPEMTAFLNRLDAMEPTPQREAIKMLLFLGGQRPTQMLRAKVTDVDLATGRISLYDPKGRRKTPRKHVLPLMKEAHAILEARLNAIGDRTDVPVFSTDDKTPMRSETLSNLITALSADMLKKKDVREPFQLRDVRRTCETMMAGLKISKDIRAQLLSHGLGGVQQRHYDHHEYALEKQQALKKWAAHLSKLKSGKVAVVVPMRRTGKV